MQDQEPGTATIQRSPDQIPISRKKGVRGHKLDAGAKDLASHRSLCAAFGAFLATRSRQRLGRGTEAKRNTAVCFVRMPASKGKKKRAM